MQYDFKMRNGYKEKSFPKGRLFFCFGEGGKGKKVVREFAQMYANGGIGRGTLHVPFVLVVEEGSVLNS